MAPDRSTGRHRDRADQFGPSAAGFWPPGTAVRKMAD